MEDVAYLMESEEESIRLEAKTDPAVVEQQALWAQIRPGMRVADLGCGCGKTTYLLYALVQPGGTAVGVDVSEKRLEYAQDNYAREGIEFVRGDIWRPLDELGSFDFVWVRFVLEYFRSNGCEIVANASRILKPGGTLCLIDLDHNCLSHFGLSERLERAIAKCARVLEEEFNFDPYAGRKLYSYLYDLGYEDVAVSVSAHHLIYGALGSVDAFNWAKKLEVVSRKAGVAFDEYAGGCEELMEEFTRFFSSPRRFSYTPLICARGCKPAHT
jgi:ubiquinone/menaquinone biosynthesis C-methylase UbiE